MSYPYTPEDPLKYWSYRYDAGNHEWHTETVNPLLVKYYGRLNPDGSVKKILVTMCGMSVDMNWFVEKGLEVVGVDIALQGIKKYMSTSGHKWSESAAPQLGPDAQLFTVPGGSIDCVAPYIVTEMVQLSCIKLLDILSAIEPLDIVALLHMLIHYS
ncbi:thiopurine s-methyltransferase [Plakobranchus ocellatus]|uniref:Thiopurine s-methyltransferase n=1 Tax=Plakobranchus ocellatus TaxID=259542 RepID=A0AAV3YF56_9GAST|nr:thiopurine s-methyltransferase [Plakobranchus ocellatus]